MAKERTRDEKLRIARGNIQQLIAQGAEDDEISTFVTYAKTRIPNLRPSEIFDPNQAQFVRDFRAQGQPLPQAETASQAGANIATLGMSVAIPGAGPAAQALMRAPAIGAGRVMPFLRETGRVAAGAGIGSAVGELAGPGEPDLAGAVGRTALRTGEAVALNTAFRGLAEVFGFLRGAGPTALQKKGQEFAKGTKFEGRVLPARAEQFAPSTSAGKLGRGIQRTVAGRLWAKQQGQKVARFLEGEVLRLSGSRTFVDASNSVARIAPILGSKNVARLRKGITIDEPGPFLNQLFSPANIPMVRSLRSASREAFEEARAAWFQTAIRDSIDDSVPAATHLLFAGNKLRNWFEGNRKMIRATMGAEQERVLDGFTAYMKFASPTAKRAFQDAASIGDLVQTGAEAGLLAGVGGPLGQLAVGTAETTAAGLSVLLSRPGNVVYRLFSEPLTGAKAAVSRGLRLGTQAAAFRAVQPTGERPRKQQASRGGDPRFPAQPPKLPNG